MLRAKRARDYQGIFPGPGTEPGESRLYVIGDDVRLMDWNVTARTTFPHVREPIADHELDIWLLADMSASQHFGTARNEKRELVVATAAAFEIPATRLANRIGALILTGEGSRAVPARSGRNHLLSILSHILVAGGSEGGGRTNLAKAMDHLGRLARRRGVVVGISDFLVTPDWPTALGRLGLRHDLIVVEVIDPRELELPAVGILTLVDPETGTTRMVDTAGSRLRARYADAAIGQRRAIAAEIRRSGADHLVVQHRPGLPPRRRRLLPSAPAAPPRHASSGTTAKMNEKNR